MILTIGNTKGGVGKTTLAINIAATRALQGKDVFIIDADRQRTSQTAISIRANSGVIPGIACSSYSDGPILRSQLIQQKDKYDDVIIDAGGRDSTALRASLILSDVLLVPYRPGSFDVWALQDMSDLIAEARSLRDGLKVYSVINAADPNPNSIDNKEASSIISDYPEFEFIPHHIVGRKAFSNAAGSGLSVFEIKPQDDKANTELNTIINILYK